MRLIFATVALAAACTLAAPPAVAIASQATPQAPPRADAPPPGTAVPDGAFTAGQVQKWFEAFTVLQAQEALNLSESQYGRFVTRLKALQDTRRQHQQARNRILADIRRLTNPNATSADEATITERLKALRDEDDRAAGEVRKAYDAIDETLDVRQQGRFRLFEERMEQQKVELLMRARQNARGAAKGR
ncbi:MAG TPA: hypothetical protein VGI12_00310 [Vicinamibacterales bacterium]|jgi:hypothetical protein